jgi:hypothetical protein
MEPSGQARRLNLQRLWIVTVFKRKVSADSRPIQFHRPLEGLSHCVMGTPSARNRRLLEVPEPCPPRRARHRNQCTGDTQELDVWV